MDDIINDLFNKLNQPVYFLNGHGCTTCPYSHEYDRSKWLHKPWAKIPGFAAPKKHVYFTVPDNTIIVYMIHPGEFYTDSKLNFIVYDEFESPGNMASYLMRHSASDLPEGSAPNPYASLLRCGPHCDAVDMGLSFKPHKHDITKPGIFNLGENVPTLANKSIKTLLPDIYDREYILISEIICRILHERPGGGIFVIASCASYQNEKLINVADQYESHLYKMNLEFANLYPLISSIDGPIFHRMNILYPLFANDWFIYPPTMCNTHAIAFAKAIGVDSVSDLGMISKSIGKDSRGREEWEWIEIE